MDRRQWTRYALVLLGILALAPPVGFLAQLFGGATLCGPLCGRMAIGAGLPGAVCPVRGLRRPSPAHPPRGALEGATG